MTNDNQDAGGPLFLTVDGILSEHERLLCAQSAQSDRPDLLQDLLQIRGFVERLTRSGAYFDEASERKAAQGILDYWTSELAKHQADEGMSGQSRRTIYEFNAQALRALQHDFENPFGRVSELMDSLSQADRHSAAVILKAIDGTAKASNLRFQEGLLKELASQVAGGREDATLLEFCLWHLFEDPETRTGNKIYRPKKARNQDERVDFFSCKVFLVRKADELLEALPEPERDALIDALMSMSAGTADAHRPRTLVRSLMVRLGDISESVQARVHPTSSQAGQFSLYEKGPLTLTEFLERSRLTFCNDGRWRIAHPALEERWDPLKKRKWEVEQKEKRNRGRVFVISTVVLAALVTSLTWIAWSLVWTNLAMEHLANAQTSSDLKEGLAESVAGLQASKLSMTEDKSYASQVANVAIGAVIGARARNRALGTLPAYPSIPSIECERTQVFGGSDSYSVTITSDFAPPARFGNLDACPLFATNLDGTLLAAAWDKRGGVTVKVFRLPAGFRLGTGKNATLVEADLEEEGAPWMATEALKPLKLTQLLGEAPKKRGAKTCKDRSLRFSEDDKTVSFECLYSGDSGSELEWIPFAVEGSASDLAANASGNAFERIQKLVMGNSAAESALRDEPKGAASVFLGPRSGPKPGFVTVRGDGYVQIWHGDKEQPYLSAEFRSDFVRVATGGRPSALDVQDADRDPIYAIYALSPSPVIRVYQQRSGKHATLLMEHYPPPGVGTPVGIKFTTKAHCLQIRGKTRNAADLAMVDYYLMLDPDRLLAVGKALAKDLELQSPTAVLPAYHEAIKKQCYGG
jgi:hypothetical protein